MDGDCSAIQRPGQFVEVEIPGKYLRRPISVCDVEGDQLTLIYKELVETTQDRTKVWKKYGIIHNIKI